MTPTLPLGHELKAEWRFRVIYERNYVIEHGDVFFGLMPYK
jgi:hypothetical protein